MQVNTLDSRGVQVYDHQKMLNVGLDQNVGGIQVKTRSRCANAGMNFLVRRFWVCFLEWGDSGCVSKIGANVRRSPRYQNTEYRMHFRYLKNALVL